VDPSSHSTAARELGLNPKLLENITAKKAPGQPPALDRFDLLFSSTSASNHPRSSFWQSVTALNSLLSSRLSFGLS
jgi:hypothetical protein